MSSVPEVDRTVDSYFIEYENCQTILPRADQTPLVFEIAGRSDQMIDLKNIQMRLKFRLRKKNALGQWVNLAADEHVLPINGFLYTLFEEIRVDLNHRPLDRTFEFNQWQSYLKILLYSPAESKKRELRSALWYRDMARAFDTISNNADDSWGNYQRRAICRYATA